MNEPLYLDQYAYYRVTTYALIGIFGTCSLVSAGVCFAVLLVAELFARLLLLAFRDKDQRIRLVVCTIGMLLPGVGAAILLDMIGLASQITGTSFTPFPSFLLLAVPLLLIREGVPEGGRRVPVAIGIVSCVFILGIGIIREYFGFGMFLGNQFIVEENIPMPILAHTTGAAFLVLLALLLAIYVWRLFIRRSVLLVVDPAHKGHQMDLEGPVVTEEARVTVVFFLALLLNAAFLFLARFSGLITTYYGLLLLSAVIASVFLLLSITFPRFGEPVRMSIQSKPYLFLLLVAVPALPFSMDLPSTIWTGAIVEGGVVFLLFLASASIVVLLFSLFQRAFRRKLLFGNRPEVLSGVPFLLLVLAPSLLVLSGFGSLFEALLTMVGG